MSSCRRRRHGTRHSMTIPASTSRHGVLRSAWMYVCSFGLLCVLLCASPVHGTFDCSLFPTCNCPAWYTTVDGASTKVQNVTCSLASVPADGKEGDDVFSLDLSYGNITSITADDFEYFTNLQHLNLSYNSISSIAVGSFNSLTNLLYLDLEGNGFTDLPTGLFPLSNMIFLDISQNELTDLPEALFQKLDKVVSVDVSYNSITSLAKNTLLKDQLQSVDFSHNEITIVDSQFISKGSTLLNLDLSYNNIEELDDKLWSSTLQKLVLSHNRLSKVTDDGFCKKLPELIHLDLSYNNIISLTSETFNDATNLNILYLNNNQLTSLPVNIFNGLDQLMLLDLRSNQLTTLDSDIFSDQGAVDISVDLSDNDFTCECDVHALLYRLNYDLMFSLLNEDDIDCVDSEAATHVYLDWFDTPCTGILGSDCTDVEDCAVRNAECSVTLTCACQDQKYDHNEVNVPGGICKPIVGLGDECDNDDGCTLNNAQHQICSGTTTYHCMCDDGYYDDNGVHLEHGECRLQVNLGYGCTMTSMCGSLNSYCDPYEEVCACQSSFYDDSFGGLNGTCVDNHYYTAPNSYCDPHDGVCTCQSSYYDDAFGGLNGTCVDKLPLYEYCTHNSQCAPDDSRCYDNECTCEPGFYDLDDTNVCRAPTDFYSCFYDEDRGTSDDVEFTSATSGLNESTCHEQCYTEDARYAVYISSICVCGDMNDKKLCCPLVADTCSGKYYLNESYLQHVTTGLSIVPIPELVVGQSSQFSAAATLPPVNEIKWNFGDSDKIQTVDSATSTTSHTYTYSGRFTVSVSACVKANDVCETAQLPVKVQVPNVNLTTYLTGHAHAKVSESIDVTATFGEGNDIDIYWYKKDSSGTVHHRQSCSPGWLTHRHSCVQMQATTTTLNNAMSSCTTLGSHIFKFDFMAEISEVIDTLSGTTDELLVGAERINEMWEWVTDGSKTIFSDDDMEDSTLGDCVVIDGQTKNLTTIDCTSSREYICMTDPVDCPVGTKHTDGRCFVLESTQRSYTKAEAQCSADYGSYGSYGARLAVIDNSTVHDLITALLPASGSAWIGLSDLTFDGYYAWSDDTSYDFSSTTSYTPPMSNNSHSCFVTNSTQSLDSLACFTAMPYICEYSVNVERVSVQSMVAGPSVIDIVSGGNVQQIVQTTSFASTTEETIIILYPGMMFTASGELRSFIFASVDVPAADSYDIAFQVYRPTCTPPATLVQPGCVGSQFATCHSSSPACSSSTCSNTTERFCYLSDQCKPYSQPCTCTSETSAAAVTSCESYTGTGVEPVYVLQGQTQLTVSDSGENYYTGPTGGISVTEHDVIGIQVPKDKNVVKCEDLPMSELQQPSYQAVQTGWLTKLDPFPITNKDIVNTTCYLQAIYTKDNIQNMADNLDYSISTGTYELGITIPASGVTKKLSTSLEEAVNNVVWIFPEVQEAPSSANSLGTIYTEFGVEYDYTLGVGYGTNLESSWSIDPSTTVNFQSACPAAVATSVGNACNASLVWSDIPFATMAQTVSVTGNSTLGIKIRNPVDTQDWELTIQTEKRIAGLSLVTDSTALVANTLKVGDMVQFTASITEGTGESYIYTVNGASVSSTTTVLNHSFSTAGTYDVQVTATNILAAKTLTLPVEVKIAAAFTNCQFKKSAYVAAKDIAIDLEFECEVAIGAEVKATWLTSTVSSQFSSNSTTASGVQVWTQDFTFTSAPSSTVVTIIIEDAFQEVTKTMDVDIYNALPSVSLVASVADVLISDNVIFTATVPDTPSDYGDVTYTFDYGDSTESSVFGTAHTETVTHVYTSSQISTVTVTATNGPTNVTNTTSVTVYETVDGCSLAYDGPSKVASDTVFTADISAGTFVSYQFISSKFDTTVSDASFMFSFDTASTYNVTVVCLNNLSQQESSIDAYILDSSQIIISSLTIVGGSFSSCISTGSAQQFQIDVIHFDVTSLTYEWDFGDSTVPSGGTLEGHPYSAAGTYNVQVTVAYSAAGASSMQTETICVQDEITFTLPDLSIGSLLGLAATGSTSETILVNLATGTDPQYSWSTNATMSGSTTLSSLDVTFIAEGFYHISCDVSNEVSSGTVTQTVELVELITGLAVDCVSCVTASGSIFMEPNVQYTFDATIARGSDVTYTWDLGDGSATVTGITQSKTYSAISYKVITVTAVNRVTTSTVTLNSYVEEPLISVDLEKSGSVWKPNIVATSTYVIKVNTQADFVVSVSPMGMEQVNYDWVFYTGASTQTTQTSTGSHTYTDVGHVTCTLNARNSLNSLPAQYSFYVIDQITSINLTANGSIISSNYPSIVLHKLYVFEIKTNSDVDDTETYFFTMKKDNSLDKSSPINGFEYIFESETIEYKLTTKAENSFGSDNQVWTIAGMYEITNPSIALGSGDGNITTGSSLQLIGSADGTQPQFTWSYSQKPSPETFPTQNSGSHVTLMPNTLGTYTIKLDVQNDVTPAQTVYITINVVEQVTGVSIGMTLTPPDAVKVTSTVDFTAAVTTGSDLSYEWNVYLGTSQLESGTESTFTYTFPTQAIYNVTLDIWNYASSGSADTEIYSLYEINPFDVNVAGSTVDNGYHYVATGTDLTFTSSLTTLAYLEFDWLVDSVSEATTTSFVKSFGSPNTYDVKAVITNKIDSEMDNVNIIVQDEITDLSVDNCPGTYAVGHSITLKALYTTGTDVKISWEKHDLSTYEASEINLDYAVAGFYDIKVTGVNVIDSKTFVCNMSIYAEVQNLGITYSEHQIENYPIQFIVDGDNLEGASFKWTWDDGSSFSSTTVATIEHTFTTKGKYTVGVEVTNPVSTSSTSVEVKVTKLKCNLPVLSSIGNTEWTTVRARDLELGVSVDTGSCTSYTTQYEWTVYEATSCTASLTKLHQLAASVHTNTPALVIPSLSLPYGTYCAVFRNAYSYSPVVETLKFKVTVVPSSLKALIVGGDELVCSEGTSLQLDGSGSTDPDQTPGTVLTYSWSCHTTTSTATAIAVCDAVTAVTSDKVTLTLLTMSVGDIYVLSLTVSATGRTSDTTSQTVHIKTSGGPVLAVACISCLANANNFVSQSRNVAVEGSCSDGCDETTTFGWTVTDDSGNTVILTSEQISTATNSKSLAIKDNVLADGTGYTFKLTATTDSNSGWSAISLEASSVPYGGTCIIADATITPLTERVTVICQDWLDPDPTMVLHYKITVLGTDGEQYIVYYGRQAQNDVYLAPWPSTNMQNVEVTVTILNDNNAGVTVYPGHVEFTPPVLGTDISEVDFIVEHIKSEMPAIVQQNNPRLIVQYSLAILLMLNEPSAVATAAGATDTECAKRVAIRDLVAKAIVRLPRTMLQDILQVASAVNYLTKYPNELSVMTQWDVMTFIENVKAELSARVQQGADQRDFQPGNLLTIIHNTLASFTATAPCGTSTDTAVFGNASQYVPQISTSEPETSFSSDEAQKQAMIEKSFLYSEEVIVLSLMPKLPGEAAITVQLSGGQLLVGKRLLVSDIAAAYSHNGARVEVPAAALKDYDRAADVLQVLQFSTQSLNYASDDGGDAVNTASADVSLYSPDGTVYQVTGLTDGENVKLALFADTVTPYEITAAGLVKASEYDPLQAMTYSSVSLETGKTISAALPNNETESLGRHIQIRVAFDGEPANAELSATLYKNDVAYTDSDGEALQPKTITPEMMAHQYDHRFYTFYVPPEEEPVSNAFSVQLKSSHAAQVSMGEYFTKCMFYNPASSVYSDVGCAATSESIAVVAVCECSHMTSYGATLRLSPDAIDFTDLTKLDIVNNPVAIVTCSVLLVLYIVMVIVCRRLDHMDVKRISTIPLCGRDGSFKYEVTVVTGRLISAGTTAHVGIRICGEYGKSARQHIFKPGAFQRNCADMFIIAYDVNLGELRKIQIWHDNTGSSPSWHLNRVIVKDLQTDTKYFFFANKWLTLEEEHGCIEREIKAADSAEMMRFSRRMKSATFSSLADQHIWLSMLNRPAQSRFTRVQRATCCMTLLYTFIGVNAMWYGLLKSGDSSLGWGSFGWEEVVLGLVSNLMVFPINIAIVMLFKKSRLKSTFLEHIQKPQTAETLEIENLCENSQSGSFQSSYVGVPFDLERQSTIESMPQYTATGLHRSRHVNNAKRDSIGDSILKQGSSRTVPSSRSPMWNQDSIMNWPEKTPFGVGDLDSRPSTSSTIAPGSGTKLVPAKPGVPAPVDTKGKSAGKNDSEELLEYLNNMETELSDTDRGKAGTKKPSLRRPTAHRSNWGSLEDILHSDDDSSIADSSKRLVKKRGSTTSSTHSKKFNPRADPRITGNTRWPRPRESLVSSTIGEESLLECESDQGVASALRPGYYRDMTVDSHLLPVPAHKEGCTLPPWCVYVAYVLCFMLSAFSVIIVILYCFKLGYDESLEWILACLLSLVQSVILFEPIKVLFIAAYVVAMFRIVEEKEDEDAIHVASTYDTSNEKIKDVKFKPISGFALMQAREDGRKISRLKEMLRQFIAYIFYLWLIIVIVYVNFQYSTYLLTKHVEHNFIDATTTNDVSFRNISSIAEFWEWSEGVLTESLHLQDTLPDEEHGFLLGAARMRLIRSTERTCEASSAAATLGAAILTNRTCYGTNSFEEDTKFYGEGWNESSYNLSWKHQTGTQLGGGDHRGHMGLYGGGGYAQVLGTSQAHTLTLLQDLRSHDWLNLRARAVFVEWSIYSAGSDTTATVFLLVEFPLTGGATTSHEIQSQKLLWFQDGRVDPLIICEIILLLVVVYSMIHVALSIRDKGRQFFTDWWNWYEMLTTLMTTVAIGMYIGSVVEATNAFNSFLADQSGFTNFERAAYVHVAMRYLHACLLFLLMFKVVKQLRFIKFMYVYERTLSNAVGMLLGAALIFLILLLVYAQVGHLMYGRFVAGFQTFGHTISTLMVIIRGTFDFWPLLDYHPAFSHFYLYSYYAFVYGLLIALVISILNSTYRATKSQMFYKASLEMRDHEMVDFMLKRFKLWAGITKPKPAFRKVKFQGLPSLSSRTSSSYSSRSSTTLGSSSPVGPEFSQIQLNSLLARVGPTWQAVLWRLDKILSLDTEEEELVTKTESEAKELNWKIRINELERQRCELLNWKTGEDAGPGAAASKPPLDPRRKHEILKKISSLSDSGTLARKAPASVTGASRAALTPNDIKQGQRPISDQGARIELKQTASTAAKTVQKFFKSVKPSKPAWNGQ